MLRLVNTTHDHSSFRAYESDQRDDEGRVRWVVQRANSRGGWDSHGYFLEEYGIYQSGDQDFGSAYDALRHAATL